MAGLQTSRANTLDGILEELPELPSGYFSFPVDDFFDNYVEELGLRGLQDASAESGSHQDPGHKDQQVTSGQAGAKPLSSKLPLSSAMSLDLPIIPDVGSLSQPIVSLPQTTAPTPFAVPTSEAGGALFQGQQQGGRPNSEDGSASWEQQAKADNGRPKRNAGHQDYNLEDNGMDSDSGSEHKQTRTSRGVGKTKRNAKQQVQNKQAQQRYRERRKQRFVEMEHAIDGLTAKVQQMQAVQSQNALLQAKRDELEAMLMEKEQELEQLRAQVQSGQPGGGAEAENTPEQRRKAEEANVRQCQATAAAHVQGLRDFIDEHGLRNANPTGEGVDPAIIQQLAEMVGRGCSTCQSAMRAEGVKVLKLMSRDVAHLSRIDCLRQCNKWSKVLETLRLTGLQKEQLMLMRRNHLRNLRQVYEARQQLNMQAMALMLPQTERACGKDLDGKMECMSLRGYSSCAQQTVELDDILNSVRENLRLEQKHVMEMNFVTMHRLMSPLQAALFLVEVHPAYCDALALANILAIQVEGEAPAKELQKVDSCLSHGRSSTSSDNKSDTCPLLRGELDTHESSGR